MTANFESELARLAASAGRLADLFDRVADGLEAGEGTIKVRKDAAGQLARTELVYDPRGGHFDHTHQATGGQPELVFHGEGAATPMPAPQTPQEPAPASAPSPVAAQVEGQGVGAPAAPAPAGPPVNPFTTEQAPAPAEKKKGRRTHEELAADAGVRLEDVKAWLGDKKVTKAAIEEYAKLKREYEAANPSTAQPGVSTPPDGSHLPQAAPVQAPPTQEWPAEGQTMDQAANPQQAPLPAQASHPFGAPQGAAPDFGSGAVPQAAPAPTNPFATHPSAEPQFSPFETTPYQP